MALYARKGSPVDAVQWFKMGDHPEVKSSKIGLNLPEGSIVVVDGQECGYLDGTVVRPGDWIIENLSSIGGKPNTYYSLVTKEGFARDYVPVEV